MELFHSPQAYMYNLHTYSSSEAKRIWRKTIREKWDNKCAYCDSEEELTIDHVIPQSKGGSDFTTNVVCCCKSCNHSKGHLHWQEWYKNQSFYSEEKEEKIKDWISGENQKLNLYVYGKRTNKLN